MSNLRMAVLRVGLFEGDLSPEAVDASLDLELKEVLLDSPWSRDNCAFVTKPPHH